MSAPLDIARNDPRVFAHALLSVAAALRVSKAKAYAEKLYAVEEGLSARHGKLAWDAPVPEGHARVAMVQALAAVPPPLLRTLTRAGLIAIEEAGTA
ncbi:hypothetical protein OV208_40090 [Corallococcus sp. bb12-1]|uniref:hypothetical protein n=1 Tax=Corallococcus sp. bb12-1 TaxID=2996784 RepID=UPI00226DE01B|nr:hypothetical protein [Corallococcus sp. bb12-1]MCY1047569.1 hypothetical protein [Corallococcus sp. bb12-1]